MNIFLLDCSPTMGMCWAKEFSDVINNVKVITGYLNKDFLNKYNIDTIVSPANSFGLMDGGYDKAISDTIGWDIIPKIQSALKEQWYGEQPIGTSLTVEHNGYKVIHVPTMRIPSMTRETLIVYQAMRVTLIEAIKQGSKNIVIPAFCGGCGKVDETIIAYLMRKAYNQVMHYNGKIYGWNEIPRI